MELCVKANCGGAMWNLCEPFTQSDETQDFFGYFGYSWKAP